MATELSRPSAQSSTPAIMVNSAHDGNEPSQLMR
jgi:hypothetical protein